MLLKFVPVNSVFRFRSKNSRDLIRWYFRIGIDNYCRVDRRKFDRRGREKFLITARNKNKDVDLF